MPYSRDADQGLNARREFVISSGGTVRFEMKPKLSNFSNYFGTGWVSVAGNKKYAHRSQEEFLLDIGRLREEPCFAMGASPVKSIKYGMGAMGYATLNTRKATLFLGEQDNLPEDVI
jgi:hypothetical protein